MIIVADYETYYDKVYSLKRMSPVEYLLDPRFECMGCAFHIISDDSAPFWLDAPDLPRFYAELKRLQDTGETLIFLSHNQLFDGCISYWHYNLLPDLLIDTMGMARVLVYAFTGRVSLEKLAEFLGLPPKGGFIKNVSGLHADDIKRLGQWEQYTHYACHDAYLCGQIFKRLEPFFPKEEFLIMDMVLRCAVVPRFRLDTDLLAQNKNDIAQQKALLLQRCGLNYTMDENGKVSVPELMSNDKFAACLEALGYEPPMKPSPSNPEKMIYAFAKSDPQMVEWAETGKDAIQNLVAARVGHKSTLAETRAQRLLDISQLQWPNGLNVGARDSWGPIPLRYAGAHTLRLSGDWGLNPQNWNKYTTLPDGTRVVGALRRAHKAPPGHKVVKRDASQIEARIVGWLAGETELVEAFRDGEDIYSIFATEEIYHYPVGKDTPDERFIGKQAILGLGFQQGPEKFARAIPAKSYEQMGRTIEMPLPLSMQIVQRYRRRFSNIPRNAWYVLQKLIPSLASTCSNVEFGPVTFRKQCIELPNGTFLFYVDLHEEGGEWWCKYGHDKKKIFGGKLFENIVQALARILTMGAALRMQMECPHLPRLAHQVHDDLVYIVPDAQVEEVDAALEFYMNETPAWAAGLPLASEGGVGPSYGEAK